MLNNIEYNLNRIFVTFAVVCLTAPTLGVLIGGYLIEKIGGYTNKHAFIQALLQVVVKCLYLYVQIIGLLLH